MTQGQTILNKYRVDCYGPALLTCMVGKRGICFEVRQVNVFVIRVVVECYSDIL